jgi:formylglycine-generating enzyme required for sulfatase activity
VLGIVLFASVVALAGDETTTPPPGLLLVEGGKTKIGSNADQVEKIVLEQENLRNALAGETPQHTADVKSFYLMPTEVTNEQYQVFVKATGARPPRSWGAKALLAGQSAFVEEQGKARQEARAAGQPFEAKLFDAEIWWEENWEGAEWEIPAAELTHPVVFVNYADAQHYARWAGLRLMTEFEYQRAARGDSARTYPWGDEWDDRKYCQSQHIGKDLSAAVGSFPDGAVNGIHDLAGNVWEWTSSPFTAYPGYKALRIMNKKRAIECLAPFDPNERVAVSGSFQMDKIGVRIPVRRNTDRRQSTNAMGFRCAASTTAGLDPATWIIERDLNLATLGTETELAPEFAAVLRRWTTLPGTAKVEGYAVIETYSHLLWCPRADVRASSPSDLVATTTKDGPLFLGFIDVPRPMARPELDAGSYFVAWRGAAKLPEAKPDEAAPPVPDPTQPTATPLEQIPGFVAEKDCFIFYSREGEPQVAFEAPPVLSEKMRTSTIAIEPYVAPDPKTLPKDAVPPPALDTVRFTLAIPSSTSRAKGLFFDLAVLVPPGTYDESWK